MPKFTRHYCGFVQFISIKIHQLLPFPSHSASIPPSFPSPFIPSYQIPFHLIIPKPSHPISSPLTHHPTHQHSTLFSRMNTLGQLLLQPLGRQFLNLLRHLALPRRMRDLICSGARGVGRGFACAVDGVGEAVFDGLGSFFLD